MRSLFIGLCQKISSQTVTVTIKASVMVTVTITVIVMVTINYSSNNNSNELRNSFGGRNSKKLYLNLTALPSKKYKKTGSLPTKRQVAFSFFCIFWTAVPLNLNKVFFHR